MSRSSSARTLVLAALVVAGCGKSRPAADRGGGGGSGSGAGPCPADVDVHVTQAMDATEAYFTKLAAAMKPWTDATACDAIRATLEGLAADGDAYAQVIDDSKAWSKGLTEACRDSLDARWAGDRAKLMEQSFRAVVEGGLPHVTRCEAAPGVRDAATHAIRLMKKRK